MNFESQALRSVVEEGFRLAGAGTESGGAISGSYGRIVATVSGADESVVNIQTVSLPPLFTASDLSTLFHVQASASVRLHAPQHLFGVVVLLTIATAILF